ncbi:MAG: hypothetical protein Q7U98_08490 [Methylicorpusculum sp.]|uniref:hypothetical protein n=1 Tax=Methylicorpusculum sp. TaxID=2713644 RepID=UPI0027258BAF|nr:hypothetical protein [Methylicorpusculum sp.]MDO8843926.1 hypothetical protein [Methylicorpusculum sp.]MDO8939185.1 hypothetical protein [Methylicorpusculum sp.]MDO9240498.1 hypothetical protein [Methylicorpusculum sp.]MDP2178473.1 hypothetical protein [Methylicorpusculum sp.]MDP2201572.1 hypothetical protein [Methylicorpusculum sp.]
MTENDCFDIDYEHLDDLPIYNHIEWLNINPKLFKQDRIKWFSRKKENVASKNSLQAHLRLHSPKPLGR